MTDWLQALHVSLADIRPLDITHFDLRYARTLSPSRAKLLVGALRSYFRFLILRGEIATNLGAAVPTVADWRPGEPNLRRWAKAFEILPCLLEARVELQRCFEILSCLASLAEAEIGHPTVVQHPNVVGV